MHIRCGIPSVGAQAPIRSPRPQTARLALWESSAAGGEREFRLPLKRGNGQLFSFPKRKKLAKKKLATLQVDRLCAHQLCRKNLFCFRGYSASDGGCTYTRKQEVGIYRLTKWRIRFDGRGSYPSSSREPRNTNRMGLRSTIRGSFDRVDAGVRRRGFIAPTWGFFPAVCG